MSFLIHRFLYFIFRRPIQYKPFPYVRSFSENGEKVVATKNTANVKRDPSVINQLKRGSQKISIKNMVILLVITNVVLAGLIYNKQRKEKQLNENKSD